MEEKRRKNKSLSVESLIEVSPDNINVRRSARDGDYFVFFTTKNGKEKEIARLLISDVLDYTVNHKAKDWLKKIFSTCLININDPYECGGASILDKVLTDPLLRDMVPFLCSHGAMLTAKEAINFSKKNKVFVEWSLNNDGMIVISTNINGKNYSIARLLANEVFETAVQEGDANWVECLIDNRYVPLPQIPPVTNPHFANGCWMTLVSNVSDEIKRIKAFEHGENPDCRPYTWASFIRPRINTALFGEGGKAGFLIKQSDRKVDYWYSGLCPNEGKDEELTDGNSLEILKKKAKEEKDNQHFADISESKLFAQMDSSIESRWKKMGYRSDKHGILKRFGVFPWNKGIIFYRRNDVFGIHYDPNEPDAVKDAIILYRVFKENFQIGLPFYCYKDSVSQHSRLRTNMGIEIVLSY